MLAENKIGIFLYHKEKRTPPVIAGEDLKKAAFSFPGVEMVEDLYQDHWETSAERVSKEITGRALSHLIIVSQEGSRLAAPWPQEFSRWGFSPEQISVVNIRPAFSGVEAEPELLQEKSLLLLKQAIIRQSAAETSPLESVETIPRILILGGGLAGLLAAQEALKLGQEALILESGKTLGPVGYYEREAFPVSQALQMEEFISQPGLQAVTEACLMNLEGRTGDFTVRYLDGEDRVREEKVGAVLVVPAAGSAA